MFFYVYCFVLIYLKEKTQSCTDDCCDGYPHNHSYPCCYFNPPTTPEYYDDNWIVTNNQSDEKKDKSYWWIGLALKITSFLIYLTNIRIYVISKEYLYWALFWLLLL